MAERFPTVLKVKTAPASEPVSLTELKSQMKVDDSSSDTEIAALGKAARIACEDWQRKAYVSTVFQAYLDEFPDASDVILLPRSPAIAVVAVKYYDASNVLQTLAAANYDADLVSDPARIQLAYGYSWPETYERMNAVEIEFSAGYGDAAAVPEVWKLAVKLAAADWFANREGEALGVDALSKSVQRILWLGRTRL